MCADQTTTVVVHEMFEVRRTDLTMYVWVGGWAAGWVYVWVWVCTIAHTYI